MWWKHPKSDTWFMVAFSDVTCIIWYVSVTIFLASHNLIYVFCSDRYKKHWLQMLTTNDLSNGMSCKYVGTCITWQNMFNPVQYNLSGIWIQFLYFFIRPHISWFWLMVSLWDEWLHKHMSKEKDEVSTWRLF